jgi:hypothetical protein
VTYFAGRKIDQQEKNKNTNIIMTTTKKNSLTITDNRTNKTYEIPITDENFIDSIQFKQMKINQQDEIGLTCYDPAFMNTAVCYSIRLVSHFHSLLYVQ